MKLYRNINNALMDYTYTTILQSNIQGTVDTVDIFDNVDTSNTVDIFYIVDTLNTVHCTFAGYLRRPCIRAGHVPTFLKSFRSVLERGASA